MNAHWIDIFDKADCDHVVVCIPDDLQFQLLPDDNIRTWHDMRAKYLAL